MHPKIESWDVFREEVTAVCEVLTQAESYKNQGIRVCSIDEKPGIQAMERINPDLPNCPGKTSALEFEYRRHGTQVLFGNLDVATGEILCPKVEDTRREEDFAKNIEILIESDAEAGWIFITDQLNTHYSASLVELVAKRIGYEGDLGEKGKEGILKNKESRKVFLSDKAHKIRFLYTPKHCSWLNPIEVWFSGISKRLLRRGSFTSKMDLKNQILSYIDYYNKYLKKAYKFNLRTKESIQVTLDKIADALRSVRKMNV
jgi:hypothetical protein